MIEMGVASGNYTLNIAEWWQTYWHVPRYKIGDTSTDWTWVASATKPANLQNIGKGRSATQELRVKTQADLRLMAAEIDSGKRNSTGNEFRKQ